MNSRAEHSNRLLIREGMKTELETAADAWLRGRCTESALSIEPWMFRGQCLPATVKLNVADGTESNTPSIADRFHNRRN